MSEHPSAVTASGATMRGGLIAAIFLMATSAIGPGFITQTATFTAKLGAAFAFAILASILIDFVVQMNIWRITALTGRRASENANLAIPGRRLPALGPRHLRRARLQHRQHRRNRARAERDGGARPEDRRRAVGG